MKGVRNVAVVQIDFDSQEREKKVEEYAAESVNTRASGWIVQVRNKSIDIEALEKMNWSRIN